MRIFIIAVAIATIVACYAISADQTNAQDKSKSKTEKQVTEIWLFPPEQSGWIIQFQTNGSVSAQYGSGLGDGANLPKGTVDFEALLKAARRLKRDKKSDGASQVAVLFKDQPNTSFYLKDDTLFRYLIDSFEDDWKQELGIDRFNKLLREYPIFKK